MWRGSRKQRATSGASWRRSLLAGVIVLAGCAAPAVRLDQSTPASPSPRATNASSAAAVIERILEESEFSGAALVARGETVLYRGAMGLANRETGEANAPETRFKLGSVYKQLSAALVLTLVRDGLIEVNGSLCQGIESCPDSLHDVTYHQVLTHASGIGELSDEEASGIASNEDALRIIGDAERLFAPGAGWSYSSTAYSLFTATPEMLTGVPVVDLERERVYLPAGMTSTGLDGLDSWPSGAAVGYASAGGAPSGGPVGNWSTVDDLWAWHRALRAGQPLSAELVAVQEERHVEVDGGWYGYGVSLAETDGHREVSHRGGTAGFSSYLIRFPDEDVCIAILSNDESTDVDALRTRIIEAVFGDG